MNKFDTNNQMNFEYFIKNNTLPIVIVDYPGLDIIEANVHAEKFFGISLNDLKNIPLHRLSALPKLKFKSTLKSFIEKGYTGLEVTFNTLDKGKRDTEIHYTLSTSSEKELLFCFLIDVTDRNHALSALQDIKNNLANEVQNQTKDLIRINNSLLDQINSRRQTQKKLLQTQRMFKRLFQLNPVGMVLKKYDTKRIVEVNESFLKTFGFKNNDVKGKSIENLKIVIQNDTYLDLLKRITNNKVVRLLPIEMTTSKGEIRHILFSGEIIKEEDGDYILEFFQDITDIHVAREKLTDSEERYRSMYNNALVGIYRAEVDTGIIISSNLQFARMLGLKDAKDLIGKSILSYFPEEESREKLIKKLKVNSTAVHEYQLQTVTGKKIWVVNYARLDPNHNYLDAVIVDITDRKLMEDLLTLNENRFRSMIENASDIIVITNQNGEPLYLSPSVEKIMGYSLDKKNSRNIYEFIDPRDIEKVSKLLQGKSKDIGSNEVRVRHKNGIYRTYEFTTTNLTNDPSINGIIINGRDITAQVKAREEIKTSLEKEQELNRQKTQFISTVSHEFRTPLTNISLNIQLLQKYIKENKTEKTEQGIERIINAVKRLTVLINEISLVSKEQSGKLQFTPEEKSAHELIDELLDQINYLINHNIEIEVNKGKDRLVLADKYLISHILNNLLSNAIKYSPKKGKVFLGVNLLSNDNLEIIVKDKGIGIPESEINFLFDPYFRASNVKYIGGSGLGLSIVKRCLDLHRGKVIISSKMGKGTEVVCSIPLQEIKL